MSGFIFKRTLWAVVVMWAVATLVFFMLRIVPGDPIAAAPARGRPRKFDLR
jgi:peptide/nickel transport system permease protein